MKAESNYHAFNILDILENEGEGGLTLPPALAVGGSVKKRKVP